MGLFDGVTNAVGGLVGGVMGAISGPEKPKDTWSAQLEQARNLWAQGSASEQQRLRGAQTNAMNMFSPYAQMFGGMAQGYGGAAMQGLEGFQNLMRDPSQITSDPMYTARLSAGQRAIENSAAARGMQLSGSNLLEQGDFASNLAADVYNTRLGQNMQLNQMGMSGMMQGLQGLGQISNVGLSYDALLNQALFGGLGGQADALGANAQANSAAAVGYANAQAQHGASLFGAIGTGLGVAAGMGAFAGM